VAVAEFSVLAVLMQEGLEVKLTAPAQLSLAGAACVIQILNVPELLFWL
jgi:hypothetical protein